MVVEFCENALWKIENSALQLSIARELSPIFEKLASEMKNLEDARVKEPKEKLDRKYVNMNMNGVQVPEKLSRGKGLYRKLKSAPVIEPYENEKTGLQSPVTRPMLKN